MELLSFIKEKKKANLDAPETTLEHRQTILRKGFLKKIYISWYRELLTIVKELPKGKIIEIGSGGGFLKDIDARVITSDILPFSHCDLTFSAEMMPFEDNSVSAIFMIDVLHHIPESKRFFAEAQRILIPEGRIMMIEPANTAFSRFIFRNFHHENFDSSAKEWNFPTSGPLSGANGALPWMIFTRDYSNFKILFPELIKEKIRLHTPFAYLVSGGLTFKSLFPGWMYMPFKLFELALSPLYKWIAMFQTITVKKPK
jgi:SAM-dependent methyltransferase